MAWRAVVRVLRSPVGATNDLLTTMFPGDCRVCGGPLLFAYGDGWGNLPVCSGCVARVKAQRGMLCTCCGEAMGMESERFAGGRADTILCTPCRMAPPAFARAVAYAVYADEVREMLHLLKYDGVRSVAPLLGGMLAEAVRRLPLAEGTMVVAVPLFSARQRGRGYNQAEVLAGEAMKALPRLEAAHGVLRRVRDTEAQFSMSPRARRANLRGAFAVPDALRIAGKDVLVVDDIYTTGATTRECARVLRAAGARTVWVATLARAQAEAVALWDGTLRPPETMGWS